MQVLKRKSRQNPASPNDEFKVFPALNPQVVFEIAPLVGNVPNSPHNPLTFLATIYDQILRKQVYVWVVTKHEVVVGYAIVYPPSAINRAAFIYHAYISPECPRWVTPTMLGQITEVAQAAGAVGIYMTTTRQKARAWAALGFEKVADCYLMKLAEGDTNHE